MKIDTSRNDTILQLAREGYSAKEIAETAGLSPASVYKILKDLGYKCGTITADMKADIILARKGGKRVKQIAEEFKISSASVYNVCHEYENTMAEKRGEESDDAETSRLIKEMSRKGYSLRKMIDVLYEREISKKNVNKEKA